MPSLPVIGTGLFLVAAFGYGVMYPQRLYAIRQRHQTNDNPQLSQTGERLWRALSGVVVIIGVATVWLGTTM